MGLKGILAKKSTGTACRAMHGEHGYLIALLSRSSCPAILSHLYRFIGQEIICHQGTE